MSPVLGGRSEVLDAPFLELLAHLDMLKEQKRNDRFGQFMNMFFANPMTNSKARQQYIKDIKPESELLQRAKKNGGALVTDLEQLRLIKQMQEQEAATLKKFSKGG